MTKQPNSRAESKLEMKQVFRKDPPIVFDPDTVIRMCNASQREPLKCLMREPALAGAMAASGLKSLGQGC